MDGSSVTDVGTYAAPERVDLRGARRVAGWMIDSRFCRRRAIPHASAGAMAG